MRKLVFSVIAFMLFTLTANAQNDGMETFLSKDVEHGGYGAPGIKFSTFEDDLGIYMGGKGVWLLDHTIGVGLGGYGLVNNFDYESVDNGEEEYKLQTGYGGLILEYVGFSRRRIHYSFNMLIGAGGAAYLERTERINDYPHDDEEHWDYDVDENSAYFVLEPELNVEFNITDFFVLGIGGSYRFVSGLDLPDHENSDLSGPSGNITFKIGKF